MSRNPPQTLSVKRKRNEAPVDSLVVEHNQKRHRGDFVPPTAAPSFDTPVNNTTKDGNFVYRRIQVPSSRILPEIASPTGQGPRRFIIDRSTEKRVLVEDHPTVPSLLVSNSGPEDRGQQTEKSGHHVPPTAPQPARPRKRPGAGSALSQTPVKPHPTKAEPAEDLVRQLESFSSQVEREEAVGPEPIKSPTRFKPKAPKLRFKDRHPEKAAALEARGPDAMELDTDEYVYDTYVREIVLPDANGKIPEPQGTVGFIVIKEEDEEWWNGDDESDREFDTDDEDENAEDYYANDYPEDELSSDDEYGRNPYKYRGGDGDEEFDLEDEDIDSGDDEAFRTTVPAALPGPAVRPGYWGRHGE